MKRYILILSLGLCLSLGGLSPCKRRLRQRTRDANSSIRKATDIHGAPDSKAEKQLCQVSRLCRENRRHSGKPGKKNGTEAFLQAEARYKAARTFGKRKKGI